MGWLFGHYERKPLIEQLINGNGLKTIKHFLAGNNLWCVHEHDGQRWACLYLLRGSPKVKNDQYNWGISTLTRRWDRVKSRSPTRGLIYSRQSKASTPTSGGHGSRPVARSCRRRSSVASGEGMGIPSRSSSDAALLLSVPRTNTARRGG